jgi:hypothetical protein
MPTFDTPAPITLAIELGIATVELVATDRIDTVVDVQPSRPDPASEAAASETVVEFAQGRLHVRTPKGWRRSTGRWKRASVDVRIALPTGSDVQLEGGMVTLHSLGELGDFRARAGVGDFRVDQVASVDLKTGAGDISVDRVWGRAVVVTASGSIGLRTIDGPAVVKNANGDTWIGTVTDDLRVRAANGAIAVDRAGATVTAKSANGDVRLGGVAHGDVLAESAHGGVEIGVGEGVTAWLDLHTSCGNVHNDLDVTGSPTADDDTVSVRVRTGFGDITVQRSLAATAG